MIFKINKQTNLLFKLIAISQLIVLIIYIPAETQNIKAIKLNDYLSVFRQIQSMLILLYLISVLGFFGEKKFIRRCFFAYTLVEFIFSIIGIYANHLTQPTTFILITGFVLVIAILSASFLMLVSTLSIQSPIVFKPIIIYTTTLLMYSVVEFLIPVLVKLGDSLRQILEWDSAAICLMPISVIWLSSRVNKFLQTRPPLNP